MTVITFVPKVPRDSTPWHAAELETMKEALAPDLGPGEAGGWEVGATELGDPQFYLLGPPPDEECILCISRLGRLYVLEDGAGQVLFEHNSLVVLAEQAKAMLHSKKAQIVARVGALWLAARELFEEKLEPIVGESEELLTHFVPQLAALA
jgi:hypothetical protein